ncbi:MAG: hypothetical protein AVDCRST_MAG35-2004, partial [uncultured Quadrisphaera sp.]
GARRAVRFRPGDGIHSIRAGTGRRPRRPAPAGRAAPRARGGPRGRPRHPHRDRPVAGRPGGHPRSPAPRRPGPRRAPHRRRRLVVGHRHPLRARAAAPGGGA